MATILPTSRTDEVVAEIGARIRALRLAQNLRVEDLAARSGVGARTITRLENGTAVNLEQVIKLLRALGRLQAIDAFLPAPLVSPIQLAKMKGHKRQRARKPASG